MLCKTCKRYSGLIEWISNYFMKQGKFRNDTIASLNDYNYRDILRSGGNLTKLLIAFFDKGQNPEIELYWLLMADQLKAKNIIPVIKKNALSKKVHVTLDVKSYPSIKYIEFSQNAISKNNDYRGLMNTNDIIKWANCQHMSNIAQIINENVLKCKCRRRGVTACVLVFLQKLSVCDKECRNDYLKMMAQASTEFTEREWGWAWATAGQQRHLEKALGVQWTEYPALFLVNLSKSEFMPFKGPFNRQTIVNFLKRPQSKEYGQGRLIISGLLPEAVQIRFWPKSVSTYPKPNLCILLSAIIIEFQLHFSTYFSPCS
ncbi:DgyrCDS4068 [Dimorphilus gyrociliatus]|uniref:DgyrCDS4068 n=1 Tax=Dimorphilus gyrociliatus TaxID=2664684 RepID=A0A7I8VIE6_9ANNE|nr:DgyrCDS4068 [Dimorphilus gyrociliatus]